MEKTFDHIDSLIGKYLAGEATPEERAGVDAWIHASDENRMYFNQVRIIFDKATTSPELRFDADAAWNKMRAKITPQPVQPLYPERRNISLYWKIAASVLLLSCVTSLIFYFSEKPVQTFNIATNNHVLSDTLPDGSTAFLNKESSVAFVYDPHEKTRKVALKGEAYFQVKHETEKPFVIQSDEVIIEDIGTTFNVKAYPESNVVEVFVESGEVAFYTLENPGIHLAKGEKGIYDKDSKSFAKISQDDGNVLAYKTKVFSFHNTDLETVVESLNEVYEKKIRLENAQLRSCRINVSFKRETLDSIAAIIAETLNLEVTVNDKEILLNGSGCE